MQVKKTLRVMLTQKHLLVVCMVGEIRVLCKYLGLFGPNFSDAPCGFATFKCYRGPTYGPCLLSRMQSFSCGKCVDIILCGCVGMDHAGIATQLVVCPCLWDDMKRRS
ncbi:unnamed protein product [Ilex paraguariensis]|uniref:Uncharacterized protein n=1 Tax=Ilex paraguariensis TaxID=185542 RepID=A0ABC8SYU0_9AQUA